MRKIFSYLFLAILIFGMLGFLVNWSIGVSGFQYDGELPLSNIQGIEEKNEKIYVGSGYYSRIQVYDLNGEYNHFITTNSYSKDYVFKIDEYGTPIVTVVFVGEEATVFKQIDNKEYFIETEIPMVIAVRNNNSKSIIIKQPIYMSLWSGPFNSWFIAVVGVIGFLLINIKIVMKVFAFPKDQIIGELFHQVFK